MVKEFAHLLEDDPDYRDKAQRITALTKDLAEVVAAEAAALTGALDARLPERQSVAFHSPCTLQHGQQVHGSVESILCSAGYQLTPVPDAHLCCGSAGTYSLLQPELSLRLRANKLAALETGAPDTIATANIGCLAHLQSGTGTPVRHWIELVDRRLAPA